MVPGEMSSFDPRIVKFADMPHVAMLTVIFGQAVVIFPAHPFRVSGGPLLRVEGHLPGASVNGLVCHAAPSIGPNSVSYFNAAGSVR